LHQLFLLTDLETGKMKNSGTSLESDLLCSLEILFKYPIFYWELAITYAATAVAAYVIASAYDVIVDPTMP